MKEMTDLEKYYNKFNEDKRLTRRHGQVEFITSMKYIHECIGDRKCVKILDIGAGTGRLGKICFTHYVRNLEILFVPLIKEDILEVYNSNYIIPAVVINRHTCKFFF